MLKLKILLQKFHTHLKTFKMHVALVKEGRHLLEQSNSLKGRFAVYLFMVLGSVLAFLGLIFLALGIINPADNVLQETMELELHNRQIDLESKFDNVRAHNIQLSMQMSEVVKRVLQEKHATWQDVNNNRNLLIAIQEAAYPILENNITQSFCSGGFYLLDATVNDKIVPRSFNGLYFKYSNINSGQTLFNDLWLYRGEYQVGRNHNRLLYTTWQMEMSLKNFREVERVLGKQERPLHQNYLLTDITQLENSWETVRLHIMPIMDGNGRSIGACGYEISNLYFQLRFPALQYKNIKLSFALLNPLGNGQYRGHYSNEELVGKGPVMIKDAGAYKRIETANDTFIGQTKEFKINGKPFVLVTMFPEANYAALQRSERLKAIAVFLLILVLIFVTYRHFSKRYLEPLIDDLHNLSLHPNEKPASDISELNEIYTSWQQKAEASKSAYEERLNQLDEQRTAAQSEYNEAINNLNAITSQQEALLAQYTQLQEKVARQKELVQNMQEQKEAAEKQYNLSKLSLESVLKKKWEEIDKDVYDLFLTGLSTLTAREREVFDAYAQGLSNKEIVEKLFITDNTLKYHNKNLYGKLGVKNRKELLHYMAFWQHQQK